MARTRLGIAELARLLDATGQPLYVLDSERRIVFANAACLAWTGAEVHALQGAVAVYQSPASPSGPESVAAGLCPPPDVFAGKETTAVVGCLVGGKLRRRRARFVPLSADGETMSVLALVDPRDLAEEEVEAATATEAARLHERLREYRAETAARHRFDRLVGDSPAARRARAQAELAAASRASVWIFGPPGSGRRHLATAIHYASPEPRGALLPVSCAALDADGVRAALVSVSRGKSAPGTLLLDEAERLPLEVQPDLARLLAHASSWRAVAIARRPLDDLVREGAFREDLRAVLGTLTIELPPLAERRGDIPALVQLFLEEINAQGGKQLAGFSPEALDALAAHAWPGNVDELAQLVAEAHARCEGIEIVLGDLPARVHVAQRSEIHPKRIDETIVLDEFLARIERELLARAMARAKGNKTKAAKLLGMTRPRFYRRLVQLGMEKENDQ